MAVSDISASREFVSLKVIKENMDKSFCHSLVALSMIDVANSNLQLTVTYSNKVAMDNAIDQMYGVLTRNVSDKLFIRSVKINGEWQIEYKSGMPRGNPNEPLECTNAPPTAAADYKYFSKVIADFEINDDNAVWRFYRWPDIGPRVLTLKIKGFNIDELTKLVEV